MKRGVCLYLVGSFALVALAGCGKGLFQTEEREPWRAEAEIACLKSGAVKETADLVRINPISGPGVCGAEFPLKVAAFGEASGSGLGFADDDLRPPGAVANGNQPRWPINQPQRSSYPETAVRQPGYGAASNGPISLNAQGVDPEQGDIALPVEGSAQSPQYQNSSAYPQGYPQNGGQNGGYGAVPQNGRGSAATPPQDFSPAPRFGQQGNPVDAFGPVALKPTATLACPIVSVLEKWLAEQVQPAAQRWFGSRVVEIHQISAYSCRGMNGNSRAHISEHAFGNALDIAGFTLADGRKISVEHGWKGLPEEQGFLHDVQATACREFTTVLAPGANVYHYNHIHVDLMRRARRPIICQPAPIPGEEVAARAMSKTPYASRDPGVTGSIGKTVSGWFTKKPAAKGSAEEYGDE
jgi:hypothetical protein